MAPAPHHFHKIIKSSDILELYTVYAVISEGLIAISWKASLKGFRSLFLWIIKLNTLFP